MAVIPFPAITIQEPNLFEMLGGVKKRFWLIIFFTMLGIMVGICVIYFVPRKYEAQTLIALDTNEQNFGSVGNLPNSAMLQPPVESIVLSQVEILQSRDLAENVLKDLELEKDPQFWQGSVRPNIPQQINQKALLLLTDNLAVRPVGRSLVMDLRYKHIDPEMSAKIINRFAALYQEQQVKEKIETAHRNAAELENRLAVLSKKLRESAREVEEYSAKEDLTDGSKAEVTSQQISELSSQLVMAQAEEASIKARQAQIKAVADNKQPVDSVTEIMQSHMVELLKNNESTLLAQLAQLQSKYGPNHPKILSLQAELSEVKRKEQTEISHVTQNVDNEVASVQAKIDLLQKKLQELDEKRRRENHAAIGLRELQREADANRTLYETFLNRYKETKMLGDLQQPDTKIISAARIPVKPSGPNPILIVMAISFAGFIGGMLLALMLETLETTIQTPEEIERLTGREVLGTVPNTSRIKQKDIADYTIDQPYSMLTESLRNLCIRMIGRIQKTPCVIAFSSFTAEKDKTKIALWSAKLMASSGLKILLIDADLRQPKFQQYLEISSSLPVTDVLMQKRTIDQCCVTDRRIPNLSNMTGLAASSQDITSLSAAAIRNTIEKLKSSFDIILIDNGSFQIAETQLFNKVADYALYTIPVDQISTRQFSAIYNQTRHDNNNILGFILTDNNIS